MSNTGLQQQQAIDAASLRRCLGTFVTGVTIVTTIGEDGSPQGFTANSFTSVSLTPPIVLVCLAKTANSFADFMSCETFAINILSEEQRSTSNRFAKKGESKFEGVEWRAGVTGSPMLVDSMSVLDCTLRERIDAGDHVILMGEVVAMEAKSKRPLVYAQGSYVSLSIQQDLLTNTSASGTTVGCIALRKDKILLVKRPSDGAWGLPEVKLNAEKNEGTLNSLFKRIGVNVQLSFLYSVFDLPGARQFVIYRGTLLSDTVETEHVRLFAQNEIPWDDLTESTSAPMLRRFFLEAAVDQFGIYAEVEGVGNVARVGAMPEQFGPYYKGLTADSEPR
jgi:flavin reductase (DIM6/NTAB) family NADH-FMN oxidoreductase RutF/ADP-ribose pyrophosphatase YjhB (NUDIX family)